MKEKIFYVCELCGNEYEKKDDAAACEKSHIRKDSLNLVPHYSSADYTGLPDYFTLKTMSKEYRYERKLVPSVDM